MEVMTDQRVVTVYFDYLCPFAWRGAELVEMISDATDESFEWQHFSLFQSHFQNQPERSGWQLWNEKIDPESDNGNKGLLPFLASCAARKQGSAKHRAFRLGAMRAHHRDHRPYILETLRDVAEHAGLHLPTFERDLADPECRTTLAQEHHRAAALDVFGTPTFRFPSGATAYLRIREIPHSNHEAFELFRHYQHLLEHYPYLETIRRPRAQGN